MDGGNKFWIGVMINTFRLCGKIMKFFVEKFTLGTSITKTYNL